MWKIYNLDNINISPRIHSTWMNMVGSFTASLVKKYPDLKPDEIQDEEFWVNTITGQGQIRVKVRSTVCKLNVPKSEYEIV